MKDGDEGGGRRPEPTAHNPYQRNRPQATPINPRHRFQNLDEKTFPCDRALSMRFQHTLNIFLEVFSPFIEYLYCIPVRRSIDVPHVLIGTLPRV